MTSELRAAVEVMHNVLGEGVLGNDKRAAAVIETYGDEREAKVRAEQAAEIARLRKAIHDFLENKSWFNLTVSPYDELRAALGEEPKP